MDAEKKQKNLYIETYGCQMNFSDSEIVASIMTDNSFKTTDNPDDADVIFINTCSIRDHAEQKVLNRLKNLQSLKNKKPGLKIGVLGCMAERLKDQLLDEDKTGFNIELIAGPDSYRNLPALLMDVESGHKAANIILSEEETYDNINPLRYSGNGISAFISIMRGCENFCTYCVVPFTRGKERSRQPETILKEAKDLLAKGYREITLLGQNVNSYSWESQGDHWSFPRLIKEVAKLSPLMRVRFATSHPKDMSDELLDVISKSPNIAKSIHLPVQSGSSAVLKKMNRKYTREEYMHRIIKIREKIPECALSTDIIAGFCDETQEDHQHTLELMKWVGYDFAFMFKYSERPGTIAARKFEDNIPEDIKSKRLQEIIHLQNSLSLKSNKKDINKEFEVLVEGYSKRSDKQLSGRTSGNKVVVFDADKNLVPGDYAIVKIIDCTSATLKGKLVRSVY